MPNPDCPYCSTEMKFLKEKVLNNFDPAESDAPKAKAYYCDSGITDYCKEEIS